jgi:hypothetical protein
MGFSMPAMKFKRAPIARRFALACALIGAPALAMGQGKPYIPADDRQVLQRIPARAVDPRARELALLREALRRAEPGDAAGRAEAAARLAAAYFDAAAADGDPRWVGYAQATLGPWWASPAPAPAVRLARAKVLQYSHRFEPALADLAAVVQAEPDNAEAWAWRAALRLVQGRPAEARADCERLSVLAAPLVGVACMAQVEGLSGRAGAAATSLRAALAQHSDADAAQRLWALTRLAELEERRGEYAAAEAAFHAALSLGIEDVYLRAAYADFLLDRGRAVEVPPLLAGRERADVLLLRLALATRALGQAEAARHAAELQTRFGAARQRGDALHEKEEARYLLALRGDAAAALPLARHNFEVQREPADARVLLEAALAARQRGAAEPVLRWMADTGIESVVLARLARELEALK